MENGNFKVKCIKDTMNIYCSFKAIYGKVYEFKNGIGHFENNTRTNATYQTAKEFLWYGADECFEIYVEENPSIHIYPNKTNTNETIAILKQGKEVIKTASTICNPTDKYDFNKGAEIAFNRLIESKDVIQKSVEVREVKRKAEVGEWVRVIKDDRSDEKCYRKGDVGRYIKDGKFRTVGGFITTKGTHACNCGKGTSFLYESEYVVLENYNQLDLSTITNEQLIAELTNRLGGK